MHVVEAMGVNDAYRQGIALVLDQGLRSDSRNGPVRRMAEPVLTKYREPWRCVLLDEQRDANPFFHLVEAMWMLAGRNTLEEITPYVKRMAEFSDDGRTLNGAYGHRWRQHFGFKDQLKWAVDRLRANPDDRRVVIQMWDAPRDMAWADANGRDVPCNTHLYLRVVRGSLQMTVMCRSNDMVWGAYGANAVHFPMLHMALAAILDLNLGVFYQLSNDAHVYDATAPRTLSSRGEEMYSRWDAQGGHIIVPDWTDIADMNIDLNLFFDVGPHATGFKSRFMTQVVCPVALAHKHYRETRGADRYSGAVEILQQVRSTDWWVACVEWIHRRHEAWMIAQDDGVNHGQQ